MFKNLSVVKTRAGLSTRYGDLLRSARDWAEVATIAFTVDGTISADDATLIKKDRRVFIFVFAFSQQMDTQSKQAPGKEVGNKSEKKRLSVD